MASVGQILFFLGIFLLGIGVKFALAWAFIGGFVALLVPCLIAMAAFFSRPYR